MPKQQKIKELRDKLHAFNDPSEEFIKAIKKECANEGIDAELVQLSEDQFQAILKRGNIDAF